MKYRIKFMESKTPRIVNVKDSKELSIYMNEKLNKIESIEPMRESYEDWTSPKHKSGVITVPVKIVFDGKVYVDAEDYDTAKSIVAENFGALLGECFDNDEKSIIDWDIETHGETIVK